MQYPFIKIIFHTVGITQNANCMSANIYGVACVGLSNSDIFIRHTAYMT